MNTAEAIKSLASTDGFFRHWMAYEQRVALTQVLKGEEANFFTQMLTDLKARIEAMPESYQTDGQGDDAIVYLHYFRGSVDAWITEKDKGDGTDDLSQHQAFGLISLGGGRREAELGYISIQELIENGVELDMYWEPKPLKELA